jgi:Esterase-like activity of phytase
MAAHVERLAWRDIPVATLDLPKARLNLTLGLGSGLTTRGGRLFAVTDRGPNLFVPDAIDQYGVVALEPVRGLKHAKVLPLPDDGAEIVELRVEGSAVCAVGRAPLRAGTGVRLSGRATPGCAAEPLYDLRGEPLAADVLGADVEAIAAIEGGFFLAEEYAPSLLKADERGVVRERWAPAGMEAALAHPDVAVRGVLPARAAERRGNRGLEALCASGDGAWLYAGFQSALAGADERYALIWKLNAASGEMVSEHRYPFDEPASFARDAARRKVGWQDLKVCELVWAAEDRLIVLERIAHTSKLYMVALAELPAKRLLFSSDDATEIGSDIEGVAMLAADTLLLASDNDFGVEGAETGFWRITFDGALV